MRKLPWALGLVLLGPTSCSDSKDVVLAAVVACGSAGLESEPCRVAGETCPCSGYQCPTYGDGFCTAVCGEDYVWTLQECGRARPPRGQAGAAGAAGASGAGAEAR